jgi:HlyD family secretion protein
MNFIRSIFRPGVLVFVLLAMVAAAAWAAWQRKGERESAYLTEEVSRGEIVETVSANGTLNPVVLVSVGTQVSGTAIKVHADFNDSVKEGQVLLELDPAAYEARVRQGRASLESAQATLELAKANEARSRDLFEKGYVARQEVDQTRQALKSATAQVEQARASMADAEVDLRNSVIKSPVSGTVVARSVEEGQTVAASFQTPELFKIAGDLKKMLIHTTFAEADIGRIAPGQDTRFTVDAFADRSFRGKVRQVRMNPTTTQNVVTYDVVIDVDNEDLSLLPGMTAYVSVELSRADDVLRVPNSALRYQPSDTDAIVKTAVDGGQKTHRERPAGASGAQAAGGGNRGGKGGGGRRGDKSGGERTVYVLRGKELHAVMVTPSRTDGRYTAIESAQLHEGDQVVVGDRVAAADGGQQPRMRMRMF